MLAGGLQAQTTVWTGGTGNWLTAGNWDNGAPVNSSVAVVENGTASLAGAGSAGTLQIGDQSAGTMNLNGTSGNRGVLSVGQVTKGTGGGVLNFDGGILKATRNEADFLSGFAAGNGQLLSGGGFIDTNGYALGISAAMGGAGGLTKQGLGTLTLSGVNTYAGGTTLQSGTVQVSENANLGAASGALVFDGGELRTTAGFTMNRPTTLNSGVARFDVPTGTLTQQGNVSGAGGLLAIGNGTLNLTGTNTYTGPTTITNGKLSLGAGSSIASSSGVLLGSGGIFDASLSGHTVGAGKTLGGAGSVLGAVTNAGTISTATGETLTFGGALTNTGTVSVGGTLKLSGGGSSSGALTLLGGEFERGADVARWGVGAGRWRVHGFKRVCRDHGHGFDPLRRRERQSRFQCERDVGHR